jgi:hypothetical protein
MSLFLKDPAFKSGRDDAALEERKRRFAGLNDFITSAGGWITSRSGEKEVRIDCLPGSALPEVLAKIGYKLRAELQGERILPHAVVEEFTKNADGSLGALTDGSTQAVSVRVTNAGVARVEKYSFLIP